VNKRQVLDKINTAWQELLASTQGLTAEQMIQPGVTGSWSVKDILAHVSGWEEECLKYLPLILQGGRLPRYSVMYGGIDAFNARMTHLRESLSLDEVQRMLYETHQSLMEYLVGVPEEAFASGSRFRRRLRNDTFAHYPEHAAAIRQWRAGA
jgi:hypothetical protein